MRKKKKIPLLNFESHFQDELLLEGEMLFDKQQLLKLNESGKGKWKGQVLDGAETYNTKVEIFNDFIELFDCSCQSFNEAGECSHLISTFHGIRNSDSGETVVKAEQKVKTRKKRRSSTSTIVADLKKNELVDFVSAYATKDKKFKLLLKTQFARRISEKRGFGIYSEILDECFPTISEYNTQSPGKYRILLSAVAREMILHYNDAISLEQFTDAFHLITALTRKLAYAMHVLEKSTSGLESILEKVHTAYNLLLNDKLAPGLKEDILESIIQTISMTYYNYLEENNLFQLILQQKLSTEQNNKLTILLNQKFESEKIAHQRSIYLAYYIRVCCQIQNDMKKDVWLLEKLTDHFILIETTNRLMQMNYLPEVDQLLSHLLETGKLDRKNYLKLKVKGDLKSGDKSLALNSITELFLITLDMQYFRDLKEAAAKQWPMVYSKIINELLDLGGDKRLHLALSVASKEEDHERILKILLQRNDPNFFLSYDKYIADFYPVEILDFYKLHLISFHSNHAGVIAATKSLEIIEHLEKIGLRKEAIDLQRTLLDTFPERKSLHEMLK